MIEKIGIVGGGQLGQMLTQAAQPMGFEVTVVEKALDCPAAQAGAKQIQGAITDQDAIHRLAESTDVLTWEIEHIPADFLVKLKEEGVNVQPDPATLVTLQDKLTQKQLLRANGVPVGPFAGSMMSPLKGPYVVKSRRGGYDGRGNLVVDDLGDPRINEQFDGQPVYVESKLDFDRELSVVAARDMLGNIAVYPVVETRHVDNICHTVVSPAEIPEASRDAATEIAHETLKLLGGAGVFAIEMFDVDGEILVNEIAPRVHNSGHHTIEASATSQFQQHIRAITGMPLGSTEQIVDSAVMVNILGKEEGPLTLDGLELALSMEGVSVHFYGKTPRPQRKIGHVTAVGSGSFNTAVRAQAARMALSV
jgi:5-(carboxyamino)imidazole ribonucleotide synthase